MFVNYLTDLHTISAALAAAEDEAAGAGQRADRQRVRFASVVARSLVGSCMPGTCHRSGYSWVEAQALVFDHHRLDARPGEVVRVYDGRYQIEVNFDEAKELGLGHYQGRSGQGVRRWPIFLCIAQTLLKLIATQALPLELPSLNWPWYKQENTVGQIRRRLTELCRQRISRDSGSRPYRRGIEKSSVISINYSA